MSSHKNLINYINYINNKLNIIFLLLNLVIREIRVSVIMMIRDKIEFRLCYISFQTIEMNKSRFLPVQTSMPDGCFS